VFFFTKCNKLAITKQQIQHEIGSKIYIKLVKIQLHWHDQSYISNVQLVIKLSNIKNK
jgi:hypothetical protein